MAFTGGESMMSQTAIVDVMEEFRQQWNPPRYVTIETNGTGYTILHSFTGSSGGYQPYESLITKVYPFAHALYTRFALKVF